MKKKILRHFMLVITASILLTAVLIVLLTYHIFEQRVLSDLKVDAQLLRTMLDDGLQGPQVLEAIGGDLRVTIIAADGSVLEDNIADSDSMENHSRRPEVRRALEQGEGSDVRDSKTIGSSTFYAALLLKDGSVLRVAKEAASIWGVYLWALPLILVVLAFTLVLAMLAAQALTDRLIRPIRAMTSRTEEQDDALYPELRPVMHMIREQNEEIMRSANMRVEFTANVSHELKTPLTSICGYAELIESGMAEGDQARRFAGQIHKSANRLLALIDDIIRLSQMDAPEHRTVMERVDLAQTAQAVLDQLRINAQKMDVTLTLDARESIVTADEQMMEELIFNLCDNAIRYNVRGGSVQVQVLPVKEHVRLVVQDTGIGIGKENQERVFERFYRVNKSRSKATGGTGLGLAIVKHIAAIHNAEIDMRSELGSGTAITVRFARAK